MATIKRPNELDEAAKRLNAARDSVENMTYGNFKSGDLYQGLQRDYQQQGQMAMKDTLGQVAARTGGMASSYATTAANQSYNNYMKALEDAARSMYNDEYSRAQNQYNMAQQDYNNAYSQYRDSVADQRYADELAYQKSRDRIADQRYADEQKETKRKNYLDSIIKSAATGTSPVFDSKRANEFGITRADFDNAVNIGLSQYKNSAGYLSSQAATDDSIRSMLTSESFNWDTYDWNGDAEGLGSAADYFAGKGSAYDSGYWQGIYNDAQKGYADADIEAAQDEVIEILEAGGTPTTELLIKAGFLASDADVTDNDGNGIPDSIPKGLSGLAATLWQNNIDAENEATALENEATAEEKKTAAVKDIKARIANGESLDAIADAYNITDDAGWKAVTGMSKAEWQQLENEQANNKWKDLISSHTPESIAMRFAAEKTDLSENEMNVLDYYYGTGTAEAAKNFVNSLEFKKTMTDLGENHHQLQHVEEFYKLLPDKIPSDIIYTYIERHYPKAFKNLYENSPKE